MRIISLDAIRGNEKVAKDIIGENDIILISKGTIIKKEYTSHLKELGIQNIYVEDELAKGVKVEEISELQIVEQCHSVVKNTIQKYIHGSNEELEKLKEVADEIIGDILQQPEIMFSISGVRNKSESTYAHSINVCALSVLIALKLKLNKLKVKEIAIGSLLHDIGYTYIDIDCKDTEFNNFSKEELLELKKHVIYGYSMIQDESWLTATSKEIILSHHERLDGSGYPFRLVGDKIKIGCRIVAVCDEFDRTIYGNFTPVMKVHEAIEFISSNANTKFCPNVVKIFKNSVAAYPNGTVVKTNEGEIGIVLRQNANFPTRPVIRVIRDAKGNKCTDWIEKDFTKHLSLFVKDTIEDIY